MIKFDLSKYDNIENISNAQLSQDNSKKDILEELKNSDKTLPGRIYNELCKNTVKIFDEIIIPLKIRKKFHLDEIIKDEIQEGKLRKFGRPAKDKIRRKFELKLLKYNNKLLYIRTRLKCKLNKKEAKITHKEWVKNYKTDDLPP
jgi:hypothetical protein